MHCCFFPFFWGFHFFPFGGGLFFILLIVFLISRTASRPYGGGMPYRGPGGPGGVGRFCAQCGAEFRDSSAFCTSCGARRG
jgi:hypothetical protein